MAGLKSFHLLPLIGVLAIGASACGTIRDCGFSGCPADQKITSDLEALIRQHPAIEAPNSVEVQTIDRVVYLYGKVDTEQQRILPEELAHTVPGVNRVVNSIFFEYEGR